MLFLAQESDREQPQQLRGPCFLFFISFHIIHMTAPSIIRATSAYWIMRFVLNSCSCIRCLFFALFPLFGRFLVIVRLVRCGRLFRRDSAV